MISTQRALASHRTAGPFEGEPTDAGTSVAPRPKISYRFGGSVAVGCATFLAQRRHTISLMERFIALAYERIAGALASSAKCGRANETEEKE